MSNNPISNAIRSDENQLRQALERAGTTFRGRACRCPFCDDKHPSAGIYQAEGGAFKYKCMKCGFQGDIFDIRARLNGTTPADELKKERPTESPTPAATPPTIYADVDAIRARFPDITATYTYTEPATNRPQMFVFRRDTPDGKAFFQGRPECNGQATAMGLTGIVLQAPPKPWPIYNRARVANATHVIVVEGEKCVHRLHQAGFVATTSPGGAGKASLADWEPLAGKTCYLWPDNDPPNAKGERTGIAHMREVAKILEKLNPAPRLYLINPDSLNLPPKGDCCEFCDRYPNPEDLTESLTDTMGRAEPLGASAEVRALLADIVAGRRRTIPLPWRLTHFLTRAIQPGTITVLCGQGEASKSFMMLEIANHLFDLVDGRISLFELEENRQYWLRRILAQLSGESNITDDVWVKDNADVVAAYEEVHRDRLNALGRIIHEAPLEPKTARDMADWVRTRCEAGDKVICIDPITAIQADDKAWLQDQAFILTVKPELVRHEAALFVLTHPKKAGKGNVVTMDDLAGGAVWSRLPQTILWLHKDPDDTAYDVTTANGEHVIREGNRVLSILKARNATGGGRKLAFNFDPRTLCLTELGRLTQKPATTKW